MKSAKYPPRWLNSAFGDDYDVCLILTNEELLRTAKNCPNLRNLLIQFSDTHLLDLVAARRCNAPLKGFKNLASLELYQFYGAKSELIDDIVNVLRDCPALKRLGLGLACELDCDQYPEILAASGDCYFLEDLCLKYGSGSPPLPLETLRLGHGMFVLKAKSSSTGNYLSKLVQLRDVKTLHLYNGLVHETDDWDLDPRPMQVQWNFFAECTSVRQLSVARIDKRVRLWLNTTGTSVEELLVTNHYSMYDKDLNNFDRLELPHLSMLLVREMTDRERSTERGWRGIDPVSKKQIHLRRNIVTALDRLPDNVTHLTRLGICIELETQWVGQ